MSVATEEVALNSTEALGKEVSVPYRIDDVTVLSPGQWNGLEWTASELEEAVGRTDFNLEREEGDRQPPNSSLFYDHDDRSASDWVGRADNVRFEGGEVKADLVVTDKQLAMNLEYGAPFGVSPKADGMVDDEQVMQDFEFENFSIVINPAVKTTWLNEELSESDVSVHRPRFKKTTSGDWSAPQLSDFTDKKYSELTEQQQRAIGRHFLASKSGFPAENFSDYSLPVVNSAGELNRMALQQAKARASKVSGIQEAQISRLNHNINNLAESHFPDSGFSVEMQDYEVHEPEFDSVDDREWNRPNLEDFTDGDSEWDDLSDEMKEEIGSAFIVSETGFPSDNYGDMGLPVVEPDGTLNLNALANAKARASQVEGLSKDKVLKVKKMTTRLANENFEDASFDEVEEMAESMPVGEDDWVQWEPEDGFEAHGKVIRVIEDDDDLMVDVRMYVLDEDGVWHPTGDVRRKDMDEVGPWGNTPSEDAVSDKRISEVDNASPVRKFDPDEDEDIPQQIKDVVENMELDIDESQMEAISNKVEEHNEEFGDQDGKEVTEDMLVDVYERGLAAYQDSHRPGMSAQQWAMARVNAFLFLVRNGNPENDAYTQDNDLLPEGHSKHESENSDIEGKTTMTEEEQTEQNDPQAEQSEDVDYVTSEELEEFVEDLKEELGAVEETEGDEEVEEEASDEELDDFEEFREQNPELSLSEAAERFEEENRDVEDKVEEMSQKIDSLEEKLESKASEVQELEEKVSDPQRATQAQADEDSEDVREKVSELDDSELHDLVLNDMLDDTGVTATKEMIHNEN